MDTKHTEFNIKKSSRGLASLVDMDAPEPSTSNAAPIAPRISPVIYRPGTAERNIQIEIHTRPAYGLILGRKAVKKIKKIAAAENSTLDYVERSDNDETLETEIVKRKRSNDILSLFAFANVTKTLITASLQDDPYADLILLKIESQLNKLDEVLTTSIASVEHMLKNLMEIGVDARKMRTRYPTRVELTFKSPYAMKLAMLIVKYDQLVRLYLPIRQAGRVDYDVWQIAFEEPRQIFRQAVNHGINYRTYGITRKNIETENIKHVNKLKKRYGEIPPEVLSGEKKPHLIYGFKRA